MKSFQAYKLKNTENQLELIYTGSPEHQLEGFLNSSWMVLKHDTFYTLTGTPGGTIYLRALATSDTTPSALNNYQIQSFYHISGITDFNLWTTDTHLTNLVWQAKNASTNIGVGGIVLDSSGEPLMGAPITIKVPASGLYFEKTVFSNVVGRFFYQFDLPRCSGLLPYEGWSNYGTPATYWKIHYDLYNSASYPILVYPANDQKNVTKLDYAHICSEMATAFR